MYCLPRIALAMSIAAAAALCVAGFHNHLMAGLTVQAAVAGAQAQYPAGQYPPSQYPPDPTAQDQGPDPAEVNQASAPPDAGMGPQGQSYTTEAPPPPGQETDDSNYAEQPAAQATEPPPPLPDYDQPPPPTDGYIWEPGYWAWGAAGYYWVPGAWVEPPYEGALWTPGYWGFYGGRYLFFPGHWGLHIGFYGGINYGFGYFGLGYEGGYWRTGRFFYNRAYNRIDVRTVHNVYEYHVNNRVIANHVYNNTRPSFRGGAGVEVRPVPREVQAWHEPTAPRMTSQTQHAENYRAVPGQYANQNHGRPASPAINRPLPADRGVRPQMRGGGGGHR